LKKVAACGWVPASRWQELQVSALPTNGLESGCVLVFSTISLPNATTWPNSPGGSSLVGLAASSAVRPLSLNNTAAKPRNKMKGAVRNIVLSHLASRPTVQIAPALDALS